jgi:hypothetical protein
MKLKDLAKAPELFKITIDDEEVVKQYGEPLEFYAMDRQPMETFLRFASGDRQNFVEMASLLKELILDEEGKPVITDGFMLPSKVMVAAFSKLVEELGK